MFIAAILCVVISAHHKLPEKFVWMTSEALTRASKPGKLTLLKYKVLRWPGPWRWFKSGKTIVQIDARFLAVSNSVPFAVDDLIPCYTNAQGVRAWVVLPDELVRLKQQSKTQPGVDLRDAMRITTIDGGQAQIASMTTIPGSGGAFCGSVVDVLPRVIHGSFTLLIGATSTETNSSPNSATGSLVTNICFASQAIVPNGGALVVASPTDVQTSRTNYWLIISSTAVDGMGKPIAPKK